LLRFPTLPQAGSHPPRDEHSPVYPPCAFLQEKESAPACALCKKKENALARARVAEGETARPESPQMFLREYMCQRAPPLAETANSMRARGTGRFLERRVDASRFASSLPRALFMD
jgi:hypothetical protein